MIVVPPVMTSPFLDEMPSLYEPVTFSEPVPVMVMVSEEDRAAVAASSPAA